MKPIAVLQHVDSDGPAYFADYLTAHGLPWQLFAAHRGDALPAYIGEFAGFAILGGPMSANDALPHLDRAAAMVREAVAAGVPVIGHCLGGQIMARALGGSVTASPAAEIGWSEIAARSAAAARRWFGGRPSFPQFQWHHESFSLPPGADWLASSASCPHQAFAVGDRHLALQFHCEVDSDKIESWLGADGQAEIEACTASPGVQSAAAIRMQSRDRLAAARAVTDAIYDAWCRGLAN